MSYEMTFSERQKQIISAWFNSNSDWNYGNSKGKILYRLTILFDYKSSDGTIQTGQLKFGYKYDFDSSSENIYGSIDSIRLKLSGIGEDFKYRVPTISLICRNISISDFRLIKNNLNTLRFRLDVALSTYNGNVVYIGDYYDDVVLLRTMWFCVSELNILNDSLELNSDFVDFEFNGVPRVYAHNIEIPWCTRRQYTEYVGLSPYKDGDVVPDIVEQAFIDGSKTIPFFKVHLGYALIGSAQLANKQINLPPLSEQEYDMIRVSSGSVPSIHKVKGKTIKVYGGISDSSFMSFVDFSSIPCDFISGKYNPISLLARSFLLSSKIIVPEQYPLIKLSDGTYSTDVEDVGMIRFSEFDSSSQSVVETFDFPISVQESFFRLNYGVTYYQLDLGDDLGGDKFNQLSKENPWSYVFYRVCPSRLGNGSLNFKYLGSLMESGSVSLDYSLVAIPESFNHYSVSGAGDMIVLDTQISTGLGSAIYDVPSIFIDKSGWTYLSDPRHNTTSLTMGSVVTSIWGVPVVNSKVVYDISYSDDSADVDIKYFEIDTKMYLVESQFDNFLAKKFSDKVLGTLSFEAEWRPWLNINDVVSIRYLSSYATTTSTKIKNVVAKVVLTSIDANGDILTANYKGLIIGIEQISE